MTTLEIQRRLKALGYDPGPLDGVRGRLTIRAIKGFQADRKLAVDGIAGPESTAALMGGVLPPSRPSPAPGCAGAMPGFAKARGGRALP